MKYACGLLNDFKKKEPVSVHSHFTQMTIFTNILAPMDQGSADFLERARQ